MISHVDRTRTPVEPRFLVLIFVFIITNTRILQIIIKHLNIGVTNQSFLSAIGEDFMKIPR